MTKTKNYALRPDAQAFDEIRIKTVPRFKESELSGSEWRISAEISFMRNGQVVHTDGVGDMKHACGMLFAKYLEAIEVHGKGRFAGDGIHCDQEGCSDPVQFVYRIKQGFCTGGGNCGSKTDLYTGSLRGFCKRHSQRGDQDLEDNDNNYELIELK